MQQQSLLFPVYYEKGNSSGNSYFSFYFYSFSKFAKRSSELTRKIQVKTCLRCELIHHTDISQSW